MNKNSSTENLFCIFTLCYMYKLTLYNYLHIVAHHSNYLLLHRDILSYAPLRQPESGNISYTTAFTLIYCFRYQLAIYIIALLLTALSDLQCLVVTNFLVCLQYIYFLGFSGLLHLA